MKSLSTRGYCQGIPIQFCAGIFIYRLKGADDKYDCEECYTEKYYPEGIGKHIVCIYKQLVGEDPEPPKFNEREDKTKTNNKTKMIAMRFRENDYTAIKRKADKAKMNFTEFVTSAALNKPITIISDLEDVLKEQKAIGRNINQLTTLCNMGKIICPDLWELKEQYADILTALNEIVRRCG